MYNSVFLFFAIITLPYYHDKEMLLWDVEGGERNPEMRWF